MRNLLPENIDLSNWNQLIGRRFISIFGCARLEWLAGELARQKALGGQAERILEG